MSLGEGTGATMSDDEDDMPMDFSMDQAGSDAHDMMGFGLPTESERSLMERVRQELKIELKQVNNYKLCIVNFFLLDITHYLSDTISQSTVITTNLHFSNLQGFKSRIEDVREEILRKRRAGKLPGDTTTVLKNWWQQHSKWPYPTVSKQLRSPFIYTIEIIVF